MKANYSEEEKIGQENEDDLKGLDKTKISDAVLWGTDWTTETIISQLKKGNIELSPNFQRRDAWGTDRKSRFIESAILGLPIPPLILAERKDKRGSYIVIDGKQRLLSIRQFCVTDENDDFSPLKLTGLKILDDLNGKKYTDLLAQFDFSKYTSSFDNQPIRTVIIRNWPSQNFLYAVFLRLNTGSLPLSPQELRQALIPGSFTSFADNFSAQTDQIKNALRIKKPDYRMRDVELVVRYYAFKNYIESYTGNLKDFLDTTCDLLNKEYDKDSSGILTQAEELKNAIDATFKIFGDDAFNKYSENEFTGVFNRPVFDIMSYYFSIPEIREEAIQKKDEVVAHFKNLCSNDIEFLKSLESSTKNIEPTAKRYSEWGNGLKSILNKEIKVPQKTDSGIKLI
ncbi:DUF262 domain-containing protein [Nemorincola caseinilytica]|uniref:DUF262 domain-containing protein n=1 Tax=Nemorincola caseinilytica TaxID=2054315 RepID=A0ABP8NFJ7_9BACT